MPGTAFCRNCHLGRAGEPRAFCSQCYHLFGCVVRDGAPVRRATGKMAEVQRADGRRERVFRVLSVLSPGAGQVYGGWTFRGAALLVAWYGVLALLMARWVVPFTEVSRRLSPPWLAAAVGLVLLGVWLAANRFRPESDVELPTRPASPRRTRAAQAAG